MFLLENFVNIRLFCFYIVFLGLILDSFVIVEYFMPIIVFFDWIIGVLAAGASL